MGSKYCDEHVCLVCLSVCPLAHTVKLHRFVDVARFSPGGVVISNVLPVLWMTLCFHTMGTSCVFLNVTAATTSSISTILCLTIKPTKLTHRRLRAQGEVYYPGPVLREEQGARPLSEFRPPHCPFPNKIFVECN